jgi:hypothetical protein
VALANLTAFDRVQVSALGVENHIVKVLRPISEGAVLVEVVAAHSRDAGLRVALEPVKLDEVRTEFAFGDQGLNCGQQERTVGLGDDANATLGRGGEDICEPGLSARVKMNLGLFNVDKLALVRRE